jgi:hypothetical protein
MRIYGEICNPGDALFTVLAIISAGTTLERMFVIFRTQMQQQ